MKKRLITAFAVMFLLCNIFQPMVFADDVALLNNNTAYTSTSFNILDTGKACVVIDFEGYPNITTGATITIKLEKRTLLLFWSDVIDETITVAGDNYFNELHYQLEDKGTYRCTVVYTISGTGGADDILTFEDTAKYE